MYDCLITFRTITRAQHGAEVLEYAGIPCRLQRLPAVLMERGCGYMVALRRETLSQAVSALRQNHIEYGRAYLTEQGLYREVAI